jgi:hypothetical protein
MRTFRLICAFALLGVCTSLSGGHASAYASGPFAMVFSKPHFKPPGEKPAGKSDADRQKETVAAMRQAGDAMFAWLTDRVGASAPGSAMLDVAGIPVSTFAQLEKLLVPRYIRKLPMNDGWGHPFEYRLNLRNLASGADVMSIRSAGRDGRFSATQYAVEAFPQSDYDHDIVWADGYFVAWPK